ncbi:General transcription factor II-I repeat domain-containing protein 2A [Lucilia cuprina]|nr:General transcription factor II-I repeat domain-containing protein 2A [Lucilia cuprina]
MDDESTDINNICQLIICIKTVNANLECFEEMFEVVSLHGHVTGQVLYDALDVNVFAFADKNKLASICSDGAKVMRGKNKGLLGILNKNGINCPAFHCVIHQQALFSKELGMKNTMDVVVKIINIIRGGHNSLTHRKFKDFLENLNSDYGDLLLYTEVRWLSRGKSLERLFHLRKEVLEFLKTLSNKDTKHLTNCLENPDFLLDFAFLCDITEILNDLNLCLQGI